LFVECLGVAVEKPLDERGEGVVLRQAQQEVVVVGHQAVGDDGQGIMWQEGLATVQEEFVIAVVAKDVFAVASSVVDVVIVACQVHDGSPFGFDPCEGGGPAVRLNLCKGCT